MLWSKLTWAAALLPSLAMANFASDCNPTEASCSADPALGGAVKLDFSKKTDLFTNLYGEDRTNYTSSGLVQWFQNHGDGPSLRSNFYIQYGKLEIKCKIPKGTGIIANFFLQSDDGDEIDFEWMSSYPKQVTTNYFGKGVTGSYDRGTVKATDPNLAEEYHTYTIDWQKDQTIWYMDGTAIRTLKADSVATDGAHDYPDSPMRVFIGMWAGGDSEYTDTVNWAGGKTTLEGVPFIYNVEYFAAVDYSSGSSYYYKDKTGNSIGSNGGSVNANSKASLPAAFTTPAWGSSSSSTASSSSATSSASKSSSSASSSSSKSSSNASSSSASSKASSSASSTVSSTAASSSKSVSTTATVTSSAHKKDASSSAASTSKSSVVHYQNTTVSSGPSTVTDVVSHVSTKLATITSCKDNACHTTVQTSLVTYPSTSVHVANSTILSTSKWSSTIYSTYTTHFPTLSTATVVDSHISTDVVTITSCQNNACQTHTSNVPKTEVVTRETHVNVTQVVTSVVTVGTTQVNTPPPAETTTATPVSSSTEVASSSSSSSSSATTTSATAAASDSTSSTSVAPSSTAAASAAESTSSTSVAPSSTAAASGTTIADTTSGTVVVATSAPSTTVINGETSGVSFVVSSSDSTIFTVATSYISLTHYSTKTVHHKHQSASTQSLVASSAAAIYSAATGNGTNNISTYSIPNNDTLLSSNAGSLLYSPKAGFTGVALIMIVIALL